MKIDVFYLERHGPITYKSCRFPYKEKDTDARNRYKIKDTNAIYRYKKQIQDTDTR